MKKTKSFLFIANGCAHAILLKKYSDHSIRPSDFQSDDISEEKLLLTPNRTVSRFKAQQRKLCQGSLQSALSFPAWLNQASIEEFGRPYQQLLLERKGKLKERYQAARASTDREFRQTELEACARQGHVQAVLDLGLLYEADSNPSCAEYFIEAHRLGHPDGLLFLSRTPLRSKDYEQGIRVLLAGAWCGNIRCSQLLIQMLTKMQEVFTDPRCRHALEESCGYGSLLAKYLLGYLLRHGDKAYRNEDRGRSLLKEAAATKHYRPDSGKGPSYFVEGHAAPAAGTLAHIESLIDQEMVNIRGQELKPKFESLIAEHQSDFCSATRTEREELFIDILNQTNPCSDRLARRIAAWMESGTKEPPNEAKRARMIALLGVDGETTYASGEHTLSRWSE